MNFIIANFHNSSHLCDKLLFLKEFFTFLSITKELDSILNTEIVLGQFS